VDILILCATKHETGSRPVSSLSSSDSMEPMAAMSRREGLRAAVRAAFAVCCLEAAKQLTTVHAFFNQFAHSHGICVLY
jgi:hypothetical protein